MKVHTESVQFKADTRLLEFIEQKLGKLDTYYDRIIEARVTLKLENSGQVRDKIAEIMLSVPGDNIFVKESDKTFEAAIDGALDTLKRLLIRHKERQRAS